jgi:prevent-host-death family protein
MRSVSVSWAKNNLSAILREIRGGASVMITDHGLPVARLAPPGSTRGIPPGAIELAQRGLLVLPDREPGAGWARDLPRPVVAGGRSAVAALLADREGSR